MSMKGETRHMDTGTHTYTADIIELWVWPPMAGLHCAGVGLLADSGGSGCATAWHRHLLQPKAGAIPLLYRAGLAAMVEGRLRTLSPARVLERTVCYELNG